jgi:hypothetical protein
MKLTDGTHTVEIEMLTWDDDKKQYIGDDYAPYFFDDAGFFRDADDEPVWSVEDVNYCIEQAKDWEKCRGDFWDNEVAEGEERVVRVTEVFD